jgi:hypothetical protein
MWLTMNLGKHVGTELHRRKETNSSTVKQMNRQVECMQIFVISTYIIKHRL